MRRSWKLLVAVAFVSLLLLGLQRAASQTLAPAEVNASFNLLIEAEDGDISSPMSTEQDSSASGGAYISATSGENTNSPETEAAYEFSVQEDGTYYLWARLYGPDEDSDAIYIGIDDSWHRAYPEETGKYLWTRVAASRSSDSYDFSLSKGQHEIQVGHAEVDARLDALYLTDDPDFHP